MRPCFVLLALIWAGLYQPRIATADQVGIDKVRIFELENNEYLLEVDTSPRFLLAYRKPVFPQGFRLVKFERLRQSGFLILRYRFRADPTRLSLAANDEILLPWGRAGASVTAQWLDGGVRQELFLREFEGIRVDVGALKSSEYNIVARVEKVVRLGFEHGTTWNHILFAAACVFLAQGRSRFALLFLFAMGQGCSLICADLRVLPVTSVAAEACSFVAIILLARNAPLDREKSERMAAVVFIAGLLHGMASGESLTESQFDDEDLLRSVFLYNLAVDVVQFSLASLLALVLQVLGFTIRISELRGLQIVIGGAACGALLLSLAGKIAPVHTPQKNPPASIQFELPGSQAMGGAGGRPQSARVFDTSLACFLTVETYETRLEVLIRLRDAVQDWTTVSLTSEGRIAASSQSELKADLTSLVEKETRIKINGKTESANVRRADFVTVEPNGIYSRANPIAENVADAIVGIVLIFDTKAMPESVELTWSLFSPAQDKVPLTTTDPFGGNRSEITPDSTVSVWENRWSGFRPPTIQSVRVEQPQIPFVSLLLILAAGIAAWKRQKQSNARKLSTCLLAAAIVFYPFARFPLGFGFGTAWKPSPAQMSDVMARLLTNVYRAYDMRDEESIYDRLALTITGDQLSEIYLETRRSLELENRGGARAKVDEVAVAELHTVEPSKNGGFLVELTWNVSGSVTHFGHTHYRRNRYRAKVTLVPVAGAWKIIAIEVGEQERLL